MPLNALEMLQKAIQDKGGDGLCNPDEGCGCDIGDLAPCECLNLEECVFAKWITPGEDDLDYWDEYPEGYFKVLP